MRNYASERSHFFCHLISLTVFLNLNAPKSGNMFIKKPLQNNGFFQKKIMTQNFRSLTFRNCTYFVVWVYILLTAGRWSWAKTTFWTRKLGPPKPACWWFELDLALMEHIERPNGACFYKMESYKARGITLEVLAAHGVVQTGEMSLFF